MKKKVKHNINESVLIVAVLLIAILFNVFVSMLTDRFPVQLDLTKNKIYSLTNETHEVLEKLEGDVNVYYLSTLSNRAAGVMQVADIYKAASKYIKFETHDPNAEPAFVKKMAAKGIKNLSNGMIIVETNNKAKAIEEETFFSSTTNSEGESHISGFKLEKELTNAISALTRKDNTVTVYLTMGHEEIMAQSLEKAFNDCNVTVYQIDLSTTPVPEDASALYIVGPKNDFTVAEIDNLNTYLTNGGNAALMVDYKTASLPRLYAYTNEYWGVAPTQDIVLERNPSRALSPVSFYPVCQSHAVTDSIINKNLLWADSQSLMFEVAPGVTATPIVKTSETGSSIDTEGNILFEDEEISVAAILDIYHAQDKRSKIFVSGSTAIFYETNLNESSLANGEFFNNLLSFLTDATLDIAPKRITVSVLSMSNALTYFYIVLFGIIPPLAVLVLGLIIWLKRRHL